MLTRLQLPPPANEDAVERGDSATSEADDLPEEHEKKPEEAPLNEGEKVDVDLLEQSSEGADQ